MAPPCVMVTGAGGFVGRHVVGALCDLGARTIALASPRQAGLPPPDCRAELLSADLHDAAQCRPLLRAAGATILVHAAWTTRHGAFWSSDENFDWAATSLRLAGEFADAGGRRLVLIGSCAEYDWTVPDDGTRWAETRPCRPHSLYGTAKLRTWSALSDLACRRGMTASCARLFTAVGAWENPARLVPGLIRAMLRGEPLRTGPGGLLRDLLDARDAGEAIACIALGAISGPVNVGSGVPVGIGDIAAQVARAGGRADLLRIGSLPPRPGDPPAMVADPGLLRASTGFRPRFTLSATIADALAYWSRLENRHDADPVSRLA